MTDPVQRLRELEIETRAEEDTDRGYALRYAARALLDALPDLLQAARADGWDEGEQAGVEYGNAKWCDAREFDAEREINPYRKAAADELARETREQGHE